MQKKLKHKITKNTQNIFMQCKCISVHVCMYVYVYTDRQIDMAESFCCSP